MSRPAEVLREQLVIHREAGCSFRLAWELAHRDALKNIDKSRRREWREVFEWSKDEFEAAYRRAPTPAAQVFRTLDGPRPGGELAEPVFTLWG